MIKKRYITLMRVIGILLILEAGFMLLSLGVAIAYGGNDIVPLGLSTGITMMVGLGLRFFKRRQRITHIDPKLGFMIVAMILPPNAGRICSSRSLNSLLRYFTS